MFANSNSLILENHALGCGYQSVNGRCLTNKIDGNSILNRSTSYIKYSIQELQDKAASAGMQADSVGAKAGTWITQAKFGLSGKRSSSNSKDSYKYKLICEIKIGDNILSPSTEAIEHIKKELTNSEDIESALSKFYSLYGDSYVSSTSVGGRIEILLNIDDEKVKQIKGFGEEIKLEVPGLFNLWQELNSLKENGYLKAVSNEDFAVFPSFSFDDKQTFSEKISTFYAALNDNAGVRCQLNYPKFTSYNELFQLKDSYANELNSRFIKINNYIEKLSSIKHKMEQIKENATPRHSSKIPHIPDIVYEFYYRNATLFAKYSKLIDDIVTTLKENIFNQKLPSGDSIFEVANEVIRWFKDNEKLFIFSATHILIHVVNPHESSTTPECKRFKGGTMSLISDKDYEHAYLLIDAINIDPSIVPAPALKVKCRTSRFSKYEDYFSYPVPSNTEKLLLSTSDEMPLIFYRKASSFLENGSLKGKDIKMEMPQNINCLLRIYITKELPRYGLTNKSDLRQIQHTYDASISTEEIDAEEACDLSEFSSARQETFIDNEKHFSLKS